MNESPFKGRPGYSDAEAVIGPDTAHALYGADFEFRGTVPVQSILSLPEGFDIGGQEYRAVRMQGGDYVAQFVRPLAGK